MATAKKVELIEEMKGRLENANGVVLADFTGLDVEKLTKLRRECLNADSRFFVIKNTLASRALKEAGLEGLDEYLEGPTGWAVTDGDAVSPAQVLSRFAKEHKLPKIKAGYFDGAPATAEEVNTIAELPTKPVLIAQILGLIQSPVQGLAGGLHAVMTGLAIAVEEIRKQKEAGGGPSSSSDSADGAPAGEENVSEAN